MTTAELQKIEDALATAEELLNSQGVLSAWETRLRKELRSMIAEITSE
jgi:hypothetical protein